MQFTRILRTSIVAAGLLGALGVGSASAYLLDPAGLGQTRAPVATSGVPELSALPALPTASTGTSDLPALPAVGDPTGALPTIPGLPVPATDHIGVLDHPGVNLLGAALPAVHAAHHALSGVRLAETPAGAAGTTGAVTGITQGGTPGAVLSAVDGSAPDLAAPDLTRLPGLDGITAGRTLPVTSNH